MSKISKINVSNFKAVESQTADFKGCSAILTGRNGSGKTSFLRGITDRLRGIKPSVILREGTHEGFNEIELTTGEKFRWQFEDKTKAGEKLIFVTDKGLKTACTREICDRFFPSTFDVDKFLNSTPQKQREQLQELAGLDFTDIDARYDEAFKARTLANSKAKDAATIYEAMPMPEKVDPVDITALSDEKNNERTRLNDLYRQNQKTNESAKIKWQQLCETVRKQEAAHKKEFTEKATAFRECQDAEEVLLKHGLKEGFLAEFMRGIVGAIPEEIQFTLPVEPAYINEMPDDADLQAIDARILAATETNSKAQAYSNWVNLKEKAATAKTEAVEADNKVTQIEAERMELIKSANMPEGFSFKGNGIAYNGFEFTREQLSSSAIYIAALKLASMKLGEVKTLHFDASFLDKNSLAEIQEWANGQGLQLLIERPDFEAGDIQYHIIEQ